jgi:hypothetical protein
MRNDNNAPTPVPEPGSLLCWVVRSPRWASSAAGQANSALETSKRRACWSCAFYFSSDRFCGVAVERGQRIKVTSCGCVDIHRASMELQMRVGDPARRLDPTTIRSRVSQALIGGRPGPIGLVTGDTRLMHGWRWRRCWGCPRRTFWRHDPSASLFTADVN